MSKIDFKNFVKKNTNLIKFVESGETTWQKLYELYDLYGEDNNLWSRYTSNSVNNNIDIKGLFKTLKNIDLDNLESNITSIQKAVGLVGELTKKEESEEITPKEESINTIYGSDNEKRSVG